MAYSATSSTFADSKIKKWLNEEFYNTAFNTINQSIVVGDDNQQVFILSYQDLLKKEYGFSDMHGNTASRQKLTTDYSRATGVWMDSSSSSYGNGWWWTSTQHQEYANSVYSINGGGEIYVNYFCNLNGEYRGVVPAMRIILHEPHVHEYTEMEISDNYLKSEATCHSPA